MKSNIGKNGRIARGVTGVLCVAAALLLHLNGWPEAPAWRWTVSLVVLVAGFFQLFEAGIGWCVARALGFKTPM